MTGQFNLAIQDAKAALQIDKNYQKALWISGRCLCEVGKKERNQEKIQEGISELQKGVGILKLNGMPCTEFEETIQSAKRLSYLIKKKKRIEGKATSAVYLQVVPELEMGLKH